MGIKQKNIQCQILLVGPTIFCWLCLKQFYTFNFVVSMHTHASGGQIAFRSGLKNAAIYIGKYIYIYSLESGTLSWIYQLAKLRPDCTSEASIICIFFFLFSYFFDDYSWKNFVCRTFIFVLPLNKCTLHAFLNARQTSATFDMQIAKAAAAADSEAATEAELSTSPSQVDTHSHTWKLPLLHVHVCVYDMNASIERRRRG